MSQRVSFFIDGFNVYHSIKEALKIGAVKNAKWIDYRELCNTILVEFGHFGTGSKLAEVHYFSALAEHLPDAQVANRHRALITALKSTGVKVTLGNFKRKMLKCKKCSKQYPGFEEKETDINLALALVKAFISDECDTAVIISGDTDLVAAVKTAKELFPEKPVGIGFPFLRKNDHFRNCADFTFNISAKRYQRHQLPNVITLEGGKEISKPTSW